MRSPSRSAAAPVVTTRVPSGRPAATSTMSGCDMPTVDRLEPRHVAFVGQEDALLAVQIDDRIGRHGQRVLLALDDEVHLRVHAGLQPEFGVLDFDFDLRGAGRRVEHRRHVRDAPVEFLAGERIDDDVGLHALRDPAQILFDDVGDQAHDADVHDRDERRVRGDPRARVERCACRRTR